VSDHLGGVLPASKFASSTFKYCNFFLDICESGLHDCHSNATCISLNNLQYYCCCKEGFTGDGVRVCDGEFKFKSVFKRIAIKY
jgi:hypothetical protein